MLTQVKSYWQVTMYNLNIKIDCGANVTGRYYYNLTLYFFIAICRPTGHKWQSNTLHVAYDF